MIPSFIFVSILEQYVHITWLGRYVTHTRDVV